MTTKPFTFRRGLTWILAAAAFVAVLATAGCAAICPALGGGSGSGDDGAAPAQPVKIVVAKPKEVVARNPVATKPVATKSVATSGLVNVFGEFDGARRNTAIRPIAEAGFQQHTAVDEGEDSGIAVDPTGRWMVYTSTRHSEHPNVYMQRVDGTSVTQLTNDAADDAFPCFSPDGKRIAFCSTRSGSWQIYVMDADGRNVVQVTSGRTQCIHPSFSPDGKRVVYSSLGSRSGQWEIWVAALDSGAQKMIGYGLFPSWSPRRDIDRIAYQRPRQRGSRWFSLWTIDLIDGEGRRPTEVAVSPLAAIVTPSWSPDGGRIAFATVVEPTSDAGAKPRGQTDVWTVDAEGTNRQRLTDGSGSNLMPFWAADGRVYFISDRDGHECVWSVKADRSGKTYTADTRDRDDR
jgi:Tol biopolymer transport system component